MLNKNIINVEFSKYIHAKFFDYNEFNLLNKPNYIVHDYSSNMKSRLIGSIYYGINLKKYDKKNI